ncbi:MAG: tyrosine-protein phosphatase, partial [Vicinamibacterales bacterium]
SPMIDLHTHILPGIDDGARDLDETLAMLEIAVADGIETIVATPHYDALDPAFPAVVQARLEEVRNLVNERNLPIVIASGYELMLTPELLARKVTARELALGGSRYILVELPVPFWPPYVRTGLLALREADLEVIIAHSERYEPVASDIEVAHELTEAGFLLQVNADSLAGVGSRVAQRTARELVRRGLVSVLASDSHSPRRRAPRLRAAAAEATRLIGPAAAAALVTTNPAAILADRDLPPPPRITPQRRAFRWPWSS